MKLSEIPEKVLTLKATPIPTKCVPDWDSLYAILVMKGFVIIDEGELRLTTANGIENTMVKAFNAHVRITKHMRLRTKRIGENRWFCCL